MVKAVIDKLNPPLEPQPFNSPVSLAWNIPLFWKFWLKMVSTKLEENLPRWFCTTLPWKLTPVRLVCSGQTLHCLRDKKKIWYRLSLKKWLGVISSHHHSCSTRISRHRGHPLLEVFRSFCCFLPFSTAFPGSSVKCQICISKSVALFWSF